MLDASSVGRGQPKFKTINVEANLLAERASERARLKEMIQRRGVVLFFVLAVAAFLCPSLYGWQKSQADKSASLAAMSRTIGSQVGDMRKVQEAAAPAIKESEMRLMTKSNAAMFYARLIEFLSCAQPGISLFVVSGMIQNGDMRLTVRGEAVDFAHYLAYMADLQKKVGKESVQPKSTLASAGNNVTFELTYIATAVKP